MSRWSVSPSCLPAVRRKVAWDVPGTVAVLHRAHHQRLPRLPDPVQQPTQYQLIPRHGNANKQKNNQLPRQNKRYNSKIKKTKPNGNGTQRIRFINNIEKSYANTYQTRPYWHALLYFSRKINLQQRKLNGI